MTQKNELPKFYLRNKNLGYDALGVYHPDTNKFTILKGSQIRLGAAKSFIEVYSKNSDTKSQRINFLNDHPDGLLLNDILFQSPSAAAEFVKGNSSSGLTVWKDEDSNKTLAQVFPRETQANLAAELAEKIPTNIPYCWLLSTKESQWQTPIEQGNWQYDSHVENQLKKLREINPDDFVVLHWTKNSTLTHNGQTFPNVSTIYIKALGRVVTPADAEKSIEVDWFGVYDTPREWYFYSLPGALIWRIDYTHKGASSGQKQLIDFIFHNIPQDIDWFRSDPFWKDRYGASPDVETEPLQVEPVKLFLEKTDFTMFVRRLQEKKNIILQGPPGTGKTFITKHLARELSTNAKVEVEQVQFHQNFSYEDFVQGLRTNEDQKLTMKSGKMLTFINQAKAKPEIPHVLIIDEINRGNPSSIFGEMLSIIEHTKRSPSHAITLAYSDDKIYLPENLYLIGTMNLADHSIAPLDFAFRRRFAFLELKPLFNNEWEEHLKEKSKDEEHHLIPEIKVKLENLNQAILEDPDLGKDFLIGHSFFTPKDPIDSLSIWYDEIIKSEIKPLIAEYWPHNKDKAEKQVRILLHNETKTE